MLTVYSPLSRLPEREYIYRVVLGEFLGLEYNVVYGDGKQIELVMIEATAASDISKTSKTSETSDISGASGASNASDASDASVAAGSGRSSDTRAVTPASAKRLRMPDVLLQTPDALWLKEASLPRLPLDRFRPPGSGEAEPALPVIYGRKGGKGEYVEADVEGFYLGIDVFGSSLFMLTRYEELVIRERDPIDRFPATASLAYRESFLDRPIVNEYVEVLWRFMKRLWPGLTRKARTPAVRITHDVDFPFYIYGRSRLRVFRDIVMDVLRRRDLESGRKKARMLYRGRESLAGDPYNTFSWLMDQSERAGIRSAFYFITEKTKPGIDGNYAIEDPRIQQLLREIHARGHEIGLHPSYNTYLNPARIRRQFQKLVEIARANGIRQDRWGGRQHYLRWQAPDTWQFWEDAGLQYDSTLSYADLAGFRCGVCYEFPVFNLKTRKALALRERPLIVMDQTILHPEYMGLDHEQAYDAIRGYYRECMKYSGDFTMLWHNSQLLKTSERAVYSKCLELIAASP